MKFINTEGMAFIGPGSEWFWTAISGIVLVTTFIAIYRQLRLQAGAKAIEQLEQWERESGSESLNRAAIEILVAIRDGVDPAYIPNGPAAEIGGAWEKFALLAHAGHRDVKLLWQWESEAAQGWWLMLGPRIRRRRVEFGDPRILEHLEWLAGVMAKMDASGHKPKLGSDYATAWDYVTANLNDWIEAHQAKVDTARAARTVLYLPADAVTESKAPGDPAMSTADTP